MGGSLRRALCSIVLLGCAISGCGTAHPKRAAAPAAPDTLVALDGLAAPVRILTDAQGIPHVRAESLDDLYFAWGYVTARERLWQITHNRAAARGERWRWMGNDVLRADGAAQLFRLAERARRLWERERSNPAVGPPLEHYAAGVNAWIERCDRGEAPWPTEFEGLGVRPKHWRPEDSALLLWSLGVLLDLDFPEFRERDDVERFGRDGAEQRRRFENRVAYTTIPDRAARRMWGGAVAPRVAEATAGAPPSPARVGAEALARVDAWRAALGRRDPLEWASNVFAVGAGRCASGMPILANDVHLGLTAPAALMLIHITVPGVVDAAGAFPPGLPALVSGRNHDCAWGITSLSADMLDVYADTISADGRSVRGPDGRWTPVRVTPFTMRYRVLGVPLPLVGQSRREGPHGPIVIWDRKRGLAYGVRWSALSDDVSMARMIGVERSTRAAELAERWSTLVTPGMNLVAADREGTVLYRAVGALPDRPFDPGQGPLPGDGAHEWRGIVPRDSMPAWTAPHGGFVVNANNRPIGAPYPYRLPRFDWAHDRARRIDAMLAATPRASVETLHDVQRDAYSRRAARLLPALLACADSVPERVTPRMQAAMDTLRAWDLRAVRGATAPTLFWAWFDTFERRSRLVGLPGLALAALTGMAPRALRTPSADTPERAAVAATEALALALDALATRLGADPAGWTYARAHRAHFSHPLEDDARIAGRLPERVAVDGDAGTPVAGRSRLPWSTDVTHAPIFRHIVDLAVADRSWVMIAPGNSGDLAGPHARDQLERWADHELVTLDLDWRRLEAAAARDGGASRLVPR